jgi:hypothetical protein
MPVSKNKPHKSKMNSFGLRKKEARRKHHQEFLDSRRDNRSSIDDLYVYMGNSIKKIRRIIE